MKKSNISYGQISSYICIVLMLLLLVTQFLPFFECPGCESGTTSVSDYVWFPDHHKEITKGVMKDLYGREYEVAQVILPNIAILVSCVLGIIFILKSGANPWISPIPFAGSAIAVFGYLTTIGLQIGQNWILHLGAAALVLICSLVTLSEPIVKLIKKAKK